jgi:multidrug efflux pump subunit AcrB
VPGVKKINILGERPEQIFVDFSYAKLATLGVSAQDIVAALQRQNTVTPAGSIDTRGPQVFIRVDGGYDSVQAIADTPSVAAGRTLKLSDIAEVRRGGPSDACRRVPDHAGNRPFLRPYHAWRPHPGSWSSRG